MTDKLTNLIIEVLKEVAEEYGHTLEGVAIYNKRLTKEEMAWINIHGIEEK